MKNECSTENGCRCHACWCKLSLAFALANGLSILVFGLLGVFYANGTHFPTGSMMGSLYSGFQTTVLGSVCGAVWGFLGTFVFFLVTGFIYRCLQKCCNKCYCLSCYKQSADCKK